MEQPVRVLGPAIPPSNLESLPLMTEAGAKELVGRLYPGEKFVGKTEESFMFSSSRSWIAARVEEWAADLIRTSPSPNQRAQFESMSEALPDLIRRLEE